MQKMNETASTRNREQLRERIIDLAIREFRAKGIKTVTMDDIAHGLVMSKRTLYQVFSEKEELLMACALKQQRDGEEQLEAVMEQAENVLEVILCALELKMNELRDITQTYFQDIKKYPRVVEYFRQVQQATHEQAIGFFERGKKEGVFREEVNFNIVTDAMNLIIEKKFQLEEFKTVRPIEVFKNTSLIILRGCATAKGVAMFDRFWEKYSVKEVENRKE